MEHREDRKGLGRQEGREGGCCTPTLLPSTPEAKAGGEPAELHKKTISRNTKQ